MASGRIFDVQRFSIHDGPGIRTTVFLKGCPLACQWCHSPESQSTAPQLVLARERCLACGACVRACPQGVHSLAEDGTHRIAWERCAACWAKGQV